MMNRREKQRARRKSKSMKPKKASLQGVSQGNEVDMEVEVDEARFRLF